MSASELKQLHHAVFGKVPSPFWMQTVGDALLDSYSAQQLRERFHKAEVNGARSFRYLEVMLENERAGASGKPANGLSRPPTEEEAAEWARWHSLPHCEACRGTGFVDGEDTNPECAACGGRGRVEPSAPQDEVTA